MNERDNLLRKIQAEDFVIYETILFLDGHPHDEAALAYYDTHREILEKLKYEYTKKYGSLTIYDNCDSKCWHWVDKPWPWEKEAN